MLKVIYPSWEILTDLKTVDPIKNIEDAARTCYQSFDLTKEGSGERLVRHLVKNNDWEMIEHGGSLSVRFIASRRFSHEMVRHKGSFRYAQESTRYVKYNDIQVVRPMDLDGRVYNIWLETMGVIAQSYKLLRNMGVQPQIASGILPIDLKVDIVVTANYRDWYWMLHTRTADNVHPVMKDLMRSLLYDLKTKLPSIFETIEYDTKSS